VLDGHGHTALHRHKRLGIWLQPGGHIDPGEWPADAAYREAAEELGIDVAHPAQGPQLVHVDVHDGGRGHLHLDLEYLLLAEPSAVFDPGPDESAEVRWIPVGDVHDWGDQTVVNAVGAASAWLAAR
jgi:8-oxo-dGTP pyrophosphatase MutT (NUDIX family)